jgi:hypothetical protein
MRVCERLLIIILLMNYNNVQDDIWVHTFLFIQRDIK